MNATASSPFEEFLLRLERIGPLSAELKQVLADSMVRECLPPRSLLLEEGEICDRVYFIEHGLARGYYLVNDEEVTAWFVKEGDWMLSVSSFFAQQPSLEFIELLEETRFLSIEVDELNRIYRQYPAFNYIGRRLTEHYYGLSEQRSWSLRRLTATERYRSLLQSQPQLFERVPLKHIASYLGMKPETLSRLRAKRMA